MIDLWEREREEEEEEEDKDLRIFGRGEKKLGFWNWFVGKVNREMWSLVWDFGFGIFLLLSFVFFFLIIKLCLSWVDVLIFFILIERYWRNEK